MMGRVVCRAEKGACVSHDQVVAKYGVEKIAAQRDVDALGAGRNLMM